MDISWVLGRGHDSEAGVLADVGDTVALELEQILFLLSWCRVVSSHFTDDARNGGTMVDCGQVIHWRQ